jgi:putative oxidoreductase
MSMQGGSKSQFFLTYSDGIVAQWQDFLLLVGRVMIGWIFLKYGWGQLKDIPAFAATFPNRGLWPPLAYIAAPVDFFGGLALILGIGTRYVAVVMLVFNIVAAFSSHAFWALPAAQVGNQEAHFWKNVTLMGGTILLFVTGAGRYALDRTLSGKG